MVNTIIVKKYGSKIIKKYKDDKNKNWYLLENGITISHKQLTEGRLLVACHECKCFSEINFRGGKKYGLMNAKYMCKPCSATGPRNSFYGKKHTEETKKILSEGRKGKYNGKDNPFYGRKHSLKTKKRISEIIKTHTGEKNGFYGKHHTEAAKKSMSEKCRRWNLEHHDMMVSRGIKSVQQSLGRKSSIEKIVESELLKRNMKFKYNCILDGKYQFDFLIGNSILLETHGDYWHGNPNQYGKNKRPLNE